jgi:hypothetical protein
MKQLEMRKYDNLIPNYEPRLGIAIYNNFIEPVAPLPRAPQNTHNVSAVCDWVGADSFFV